MATRGTTKARTEDEAAEMVGQVFNEETWDHFDNGDWDEVGTDNGELISFEKGLVMFGVFQGTHNIELPEDKQKTLDDGTTQTHADLYVFEYPNKKGQRWSVWKTYQLGEAIGNVAEPEGKLFRIECLGSRKASQGEVKIFSVKVRSNA